MTTHDYAMADTETMSERDRLRVDARRKDEAVEADGRRARRLRRPDESDGGDYGNSDPDAQARQSMVAHLRLPR